jgi:hypothetical protein
MLSMMYQCPVVEHDKAHALAGHKKQLPAIWMQ